MDEETLADLLSVSRDTLGRLKSAGKLGIRPLRVSAGRLAYRLATVKRYVADSERAGHLLDRAEWDALQAERKKGNGRRTGMSR